VMSFSANLWASLALGHVVLMDSSLISDVTRLRRSAWRCAEVRLSCRYFICPPAMLCYLARRLFQLVQYYGGMSGGGINETQQAAGSLAVKSSRYPLRSSGLWTVV